MRLRSLAALTSAAPVAIPVAATLALTTRPAIGTTITRGLHDSNPTHIGI